MTLHNSPPTFPSFKRRQFLGLGALGAVALLAPEWAQAQASLQHDAVRKSIGDAQVVTEGLELTLPLVAEDGSSVPLSIRSSGLGSARIERLELFAPDNPTPQIAVFQFGPEIQELNLATRIRLSTSQTVVAIAHTDDGRALHAERAVRVTLSGCVPPGKTDPATEMQTRVRAPKSVASGNSAEIVTMISHPMVTGLAPDAGGNTPPQRIIKEFQASLNGQPLLKAQYFRSLAANPYLKFDVTPSASGELEFRWVEDSGRSVEQSAPVQLA